MASVWMLAFDWDAFEAMLTPPATQLAERIVRRLGKRWDPPGYFPRLPAAEPERVSHFAGLLAARDWYAGKSWSEAQLMDYLVDMVFDRPYPRELAVKPMGKEGGIGLDFLLLATGRAEVDADRRKPRQREFFVKMTGRERDDVPELLSLGCRPHRHPSYDRKATEALLKANNPFDPNSERVYSPEYSIHSPEQVSRLWEELSRVRDVFGDVPDDLKGHVEDELYRPIESAARQKRAVFARADH